MKTIPSRLQPILWSTKIEHLDLGKDAAYIIHQVLMYGELADILWLLKTYSLKRVKEVFLTHPKKIYTPQAFHFIKTIILDLENKKLKEENYVKTFF